MAGALKKKKEKGNGGVADDSTRIIDFMIKYNVLQIIMGLNVLVLITLLILELTGK